MIICQLSHVGYMYLPGLCSKHSELWMRWFARCIIGFLNKGMWVKSYRLAPVLIRLIHGKSTEAMILVKHWLKVLLDPRSCLQSGSGEPLFVCTHHSYLLFWNEISDWCSVSCSEWMLSCLLLTTLMTGIHLSVKLDFPSLNFTSLLPGRKTNSKLEVSCREIYKFVLFLSNLKTFQNLCASDLWCSGT